MDQPHISLADLVAELPRLREVDRATYWSEASVSDFHRADCLTQTVLADHGDYRVAVSQGRIFDVVLSCHGRNRFYRRLGH